MDDNKMLTMLLAGGKGSRLRSLTKKIAKPAVPFGGKYRIIDFALSNATNSGVTDMAIVTQYEPYELNAHIGIGAPWDFDRSSGGLRVLSPYASELGGRWFTGTANAIYENMNYVDMVDPKYVLILSGDHIYKMNYSNMLKYHKAQNAVCTIAVIEVPWEEASRFGVINIDDDNRVVKFEEKPENPKSNMASMGIYIFDWEVLRKYLVEDEKDENSEHDFGQNILPKMLEDGNDMFVFKFEGYWKDVGTVRSYWEANLDLLDPANSLNIYESDWRIYTNNLNLPPQYIGNNAVLNNSMVNEGCTIDGDVENSVIFSNVTVEKGAVVNCSVVHSNVVIKSGAEINNAIIMEDMVILDGEKIGEAGDENVYLVSEDGIYVD